MTYDSGYSGPAANSGAFFQQLYIESAVQPWLKLTYRAQAA
jgi:hypothetical protein